MPVPAESRLKPLLQLLLVPAAVAAQPVPEVIVVASQLREVELATLPASITVLDDTVVEAASLQHFEELTALIPNLNWSGEGSRARYFQIRGTGELEQYQGAPNPSVGFIVDDVDLSGIGGVATTFDTRRIEVLRGPQGTRYGANALAGLVYVETGAPTAERGGEITLTGGSDDTFAIGGVAHGPVAGLGEELTYRLAVQHYQSDGFRNNAYTGRDDTSGQDELTARGKLRWRPSANVDLLLTAFHVDLDNGYDDFALDNGYTTYSDKPGEDSQSTDALALRGSFGLGKRAELVSISTFASSDSVYGFDADWGNAEYWAPDVYDFTTRIDRDRRTLTQEFRLISQPGAELLGADWVVGVYALDLREDFRQRDTGNCAAATCWTDEDVDYDVTATSRYEATNLAAYAELGWSLGVDTRLTAGLRREVRDAEYRDSGNHRLDPVDRMTGGDLTLTHQLSAITRADTAVWARVARGYKAGGFNPSVLLLLDAVPPEDVPALEQRLEFKPESLWNYEIGIRAAAPDGRWSLSLGAFLQDRDDQQVKIPEHPLESDPNTFLFFTENAEEGSARGIELEATWSPVEAFSFGASAGLLDTEIERFSGRSELEGRRLAHAPRYTFAVNGTWRGEGGWFARIDYSGKDGYPIDFCQVEECRLPDPETKAYQVLDLRAGRERGAWSVEAWVRNLLDEEYAVRGFWFGNDPPDFAPAFYKRLGDPRHAGITVKYRL